MLSLSYDRSSEADESQDSTWGLYKPLSEQTVQYLLRQYSKGHLWTFDDLARNLSSDSDSQNSLRDNPGKSGRGSKMSEAAQLQHAFVGGTGILPMLSFSTDWSSPATTLCTSMGLSTRQTFIMLLLLDDQRASDLFKRNRTCLFVGF